jgi:hypothetical protein
LTTPLSIPSDEVPPYVPREYLSVSTLMDFIRCPRRYFHRKSGLQSPSESEAIAPLYGTAMHKAVPVALAAGLAPALEAFQSVWENNEGDDKRNTRRAAAQLGHFVHSHSQGRSIYSFEKPPAGAIEVDETTSPFEIPAVIDVGLSVPIVVRIDGLVRHRDTDDLWGWEFKTTSRLNASLFDGLEMNPQILTYTLALRSLTGLKVRGMMTEAMLIDKVKVDNMTHPIAVQDHMVDSIALWLRFYGELLLACEKRYLETGDFNSFPKNFSGCSAYPHFYIPSWPCDYSNLCRVEDWRNLTSLYSHKPDHKFIKLTTEGE